ncbi:MAG: biotin/lipoyl-containing protein [Clostridium sp.]
MKNYTITVNGNAYEVTVEEGFTGAAKAAPRAAAPAPAPAPRAAAPAPAPAPAPKAAPAPAPAPAATPAPAAAGAVAVSAPMPGKILGIKLQQGAPVKRGQVILILEAMKMENEIVAPQDGTVASINVAVGDMVEPGATLATLN